MSKNKDEQWESSNPKYVLFFFFPPVKCLSKSLPFFLYTILTFSMTVST